MLVCVERIVDDLDRYSVLILGHYASVLIIIVHIGEIEWPGNLEDRSNGVGEFLARLPIAIASRPGGDCLLRAAAFFGKFRMDGWAVAMRSGFLSDGRGGGP